jgi:hypothetical protein
MCNMYFLMCTIINVLIKNIMKNATPSTTQQKTFARRDYFVVILKRLLNFHSTITRTILRPQGERILVIDTRELRIKYRRVTVFIFVWVTFETLWNIDRIGTPIFLYISKFLFLQILTFNGCWCYTEPMQFRFYSQLSDIESWSYHNPTAGAQALWITHKKNGP